MKAWQKWFVLGIFLLVVAASCLTGCTYTTEQVSEEEFPESEDWGVIEQAELHSLTINVKSTLAYDKETGVEYIIVSTSRGGIEIEPRLDSDGKPMLYEGYEQ